MTARATYQSSVTTAVVTAVANSQSDAVAAQATRDASGVNLGVLTATNSTNFAAFDTATRNANATAAANRLLRAMQRQVSIQSAKDTLRSTGDVDIA